MALSRSGNGHSGIQIQPGFAQLTTVLLILIAFSAGFLVFSASATADTKTLNETKQLSTAAESESLTVETASLDVESETYSQTAENTNIELTQELGRLTEQKGVYGVQHEYDIPTEVSVLEVTLPESSTVRSQSGFLQEDERTYRWDGQTESPTLGYELQANRSVDESGPIAGPGRLVYADVGDWGVVSQPATSHRWGWRGPQRVGFDRDVSVDGPGAVGDVLAFLGDHEEMTHEAHDQRFRLIIPDRASLAEEPADIFRSLEAASDTLRIGERDDELFMIATPTGSVDWGVRGLQTGPADLWTRDVERLADPDNVWLHEYVHTRQGYTEASDLQWFTEGTATYYAALLTLEQEHISFEQFRNRLTVGTDQRQFRGSVLTDPDSWQSHAEYHVGAAVSGKLDKRIRQATDREQSFQEVFRELNTRDDIVHASDFQEILETTSDNSVSDRGQQLTTTTERPVLWEEPRHREVFGDGLDPARITYAVGSESLSVSGEYRNRTVAETERPVLVPGERLRFEIEATNFGEQTGEFEVPFRVNDEIVATRSGTLAGGESMNLSFEYTFRERGEYRLSVGDGTLDISVREPADPTIGNLSANQTEIAPGESVELAVRVSNAADWPAKAIVPFTRNGDVIGTETVRLDTGETREITRTVEMSEPGTSVFGLGNLSSETVIVIVEEPAVGDGPDDGAEKADESANEADGSTDDASDAETGEADGTDTTDEQALPADESEDTADDSGAGFTVLVTVLALSVSLLAVRAHQLSDST